MIDENDCNSSKHVVIKYMTAGLSGKVTKTCCVYVVDGVQLKLRVILTGTHITIQCRHGKILEFKSN